MRLRQEAAIPRTSRSRWSSLLSRLRLKTADQVAWVSRRVGRGGGGYLFLPINGSGLGHLTRCLAVAESLRRQDPDVPIAFFTTSVALPLIGRLGYPCFHWPPKQTVATGMTASEWNAGLEMQLRTVVNQLAPDVIVYDGGAPYPGVQRVVESGCVPHSVWIKRGLSSQALSDADFDLFDAVVTPGELRQESSASAVNEHRVNPIVLLPRHMPSRSELADWYGLDSTMKWVFVQLGAGNINDITKLQSAACRALSAQTDVQVIVAESPIAMNGSDPPPGCRKVSLFPASTLFPHLYRAVLAAGYNSVHEAVYHGVATVFVPNEATRSDNQRQRAEAAVKAHPMNQVVSEEAVLRDAKSALVAPDRVPAMVQPESAFGNGADEAADVLQRVRLKELS